MIGEAITQYGKDIDFLIAVIAVIVGFFWIVCEGLLFYFVWRFRARPGHQTSYVTGEDKEDTKWINRAHVLILVCDVIIVIFAVKVWVEVKQTLPEPENAHVVRVVGQQWAWSFEHPGADGQLEGQRPDGSDATDDNIWTVDELHLQVDQMYHYKLESRDVLHSLSVPAFRLKKDAIPGREIMGWFQPLETGTYDFQCAEMCGMGHGVMMAQVYITTPADHTAWMATHGSVAAND
jgi:cytochrome c oxidase subunit 2